MFQYNHINMKTTLICLFILASIFVNDTNAKLSSAELLSIATNSTNSTVTLAEVPEDYWQQSQLTAFLISFFVGEFGIDWFVLSRGNGWYIVAGIFKIFIGGGGISISAQGRSRWGITGIGLWWLIDWIRILANAFPDGNGVPLKGW